MMKHVNEPLPDIRKVRKDIPEGLALIIEKSLAKAPTNRYQQASDLSAALRALNISPSARESSETFATPLSRLDFDLGQADMTSATPPPAFTKQKSGFPKWLMGAAAAVLLLGLLAAAIFFFRGNASTSEETGQPLASNEDDLPSSRRMVKIPAGTYTVGLEAADSEHVARQQVELSEFWLDQYEATSA
jgi:formylglycine-generating enzyme required for sulfatase activity